MSSSHLEAWLPIYLELTTMAPKRPDVVKKQKRVQKIVEDPDVQKTLKKKVQNKRALRDIVKVEKAGGDDTRPLRAAKRQKKGDELVQDSGPKAKSVRSRNTARSDKDAPVVVGRGKERKR